MCSLHACVLSAKLLTFILSIAHLSNEFAYLSGPQLCKEAPTFVIYLYWNVELMGYSANRVVYNNDKILLFREKNIFFSISTKVLSTNSTLSIIPEADAAKRRYI